MQKKKKNSPPNPPLVLYLGNEILICSVPFNHYTKDSNHIVPPNEKGRSSLFYYNGFEMETRERRAEDVKAV